AAVQTLIQETRYSVYEDRKLLSQNDSVTLAKKDDTDLTTEFITPGEQVGSYFGTSLAVTDLNNDEWNDLIVGAPFYFDRKENEGGAVYVFMNENGSFQKTPSMVLKGPAASGFGFAVSAIGDVNQDGFQDFAVGAPFHESRKVYIFMGSKKGISEEPSQVIEGKSVGSSWFQTFGYSISGGMDMDENSYPDLLVGSLDDRIALLRARPVIHLSKNITVQPKIVDPNVSVKYTMEADMDRRHPRVHFLDNKHDTYTGFLTMPSPKTECQVLELRVEDYVRDMLEPVVFSLNVSLDEQKPKVRKALQNLDSYPVLTHKQKVTARKKMNFQKECGSDNKCTSNLQLTANQGNHQLLQYRSNVKKVMLLVEVANLPGPGKVAEDAHQAMLNIFIPSTLRYSGVRSQLIFETSGINLNTREIESQLSEQNDLYSVLVVLLIENSIQTSISIEKPLVQTYFSREVTGESAMNTTSDVGSLVEYTFNVSVEGEPLGALGTLVMEFEWPFELSENRSKRPKRGLEGEHLHIIEPQAAITLLPHHKETYLLECSKWTARCVTFTCPLINMSTSAKIIVRSRVWNSTMLEVRGQRLKQDYNNALRIKVRGQATMKLIMPKYYGVKIRKEERYQFNIGFRPEDAGKKYWITNWTEMQRYFY
ncbi:unnamed protein product, partial [Coregonus sp. 'balchen']